LADIFSVATNNAILPLFGIMNLYIYCNSI